MTAIEGRVPPVSLLAAAVSLWALCWGTPVAHAAGKKPAKTESAETEESPDEGASEGAESGDEGESKDEGTESEGDQQKEGESDAAEAEAHVEVSASDLKLGATGSQAPFARLWIGVSGGFEVAFLPSGSDVCKLDNRGVPVNGVHAYCTDTGGHDFPIRGNVVQNAFLLPGLSGKTGGGPELGNARVLLAVDYALTPSILIGVRAGYVFNTYPGHFGLGGRPDFTRYLHGEVRGTYVFGEEPLSKVGFAPTAFFALGAGEFDAHVRGGVRFQGIPTEEPVEIYFVSGPWFAALGGGARYQFSQRAAFNAAARLNVSFGPMGSLFTAGPELAFQYGF